MKELRIKDMTNYEKCLYEQGKAKREKEILEILEKWVYRRSLFIPQGHERYIDELDIDTLFKQIKEAD